LTDFAAFAIVAGAGAEVVAERGSGKGEKVFDGKGVKRQSQF
jgi:hypothetical protein